MRFTTLLLVGLTLALADYCEAQEGSYPRVEIFSGVSYLPADGMDFPRKNSPGFQFSVSGNVNRWFGMLGDFGGHYSRVSDLGPTRPAVTTSISVYEYMAGPRFAKRTERMTAFGQVLFGVVSGRTSTGAFSDKEFAFGGGGGFDINLSRRLAIRPLQLDYIGTFADMVENNFRFGAGVVVKLGR